MIDLKNKKTLFKTESSQDSARRWSIIKGIIMGVVIIAFGVGLFFTIKNSNNEDAPLTEEDMLNEYVGPFDANDRGEWFEPTEYYGMYKEDAKEVDAASALFAREGALKGVVPAGVRIEPVLVTYEDFKPYSSQTDRGFFESYKVVSDPKDAEVQLGVTSDMQMSGSYNVFEKDMLYDGNINIDLTDMEYYMEQTFDTEGAYADEPESGYYGFINPHFEFKYKLNGSADMGKDYDAITDELEFEGQGMLSDGMWQYTTNLSGQGNDIFRQGEVYIRCKLPCTVRRKSAGNNESYEGSVNIYFRMNEVRIGTRQDCKPEMQSMDFETPDGEIIYLGEDNTDSGEDNVDYEEAEQIAD